MPTKAPSSATSGVASPVLSREPDQAVASVDSGLWAEKVQKARPESYSVLMNQALSIPNGEERVQATKIVVAAWLKADGAGFLEYVDRLEGLDAATFSGWPTLVKAFFLCVPHVDDQTASSPALQETMNSLMEHYAALDAPAALAWANQYLLGETKDTVVATVAGEIARKSPGEALALAHALESKDARLTAINNIASTLGAQDPHHALAWARSLQDPEERDTGREAAMWALADADAVAAAAEISKPENAGMQEMFAGEVAESLSAGNPSDALRWAEGLSSEEARSAALAGALGGWARAKPEEAFSVFVSRYGSRPEAAASLFEQWGASAPENAVAKIALITDPAARKGAVEGTLQGWLAGDEPEGAAQWVDQLPAGLDRDAGNAVMVEWLSDQEPQSAWTRALTIQDAQTRSSAIGSAFSALVASDPKVARASFKAATLSEGDRKVLAPLLPPEKSSASRD